MLKRIMAAVNAFTGAARQHDDITCLVLRVTS
jgi:serine phosphatase RsbU (regulator of sigma subunit)